MVLVYAVDKCYGLKSMKFKSYTNLQVGVKSSVLHVLCHYHGVLDWKLKRKPVFSKSKVYEQWTQTSWEWWVGLLFEVIDSHLVTTPSRRMIFGCENCPMILASLKKSCLCFSEYPGFRVLIATATSPRLGVFITPQKTSPNSPDRQTDSGKKHQKLPSYEMEEKWFFKGGKTYQHQWLFVC